MSPTGAGDEEHLSKTEESEVISDVDHNDELDSDIKLEEEEEEPIIIPIESSEIVGVQICEVCSKLNHLSDEPLKTVHGSWPSPHL